MPLGLREMQQSQSLYRDTGKNFSGALLGCVMDKHAASFKDSLGRVLLPKTAEVRGGVLGSCFLRAPTSWLGYSIGHFVAEWVVRRQGQLGKVAHCAHYLQSPPLFLASSNPLSSQDTMS